MPLYGYQCLHCFGEYTELRKFEDRDATLMCANCTEPCMRQASQANIVARGVKRALTPTKDLRVHRPSRDSQRAVGAQPGGAAIVGNGGKGVVRNCVFSTGNTGIRLSGGAQLHSENNSFVNIKNPIVIDK